MYIFSKTSKERLLTCHPDLQIIMNDAIKVYDFTVIQGHRTAGQHSAYRAAGRTKVAYEKSKHSKDPSEAIDIAPFPIDWHDRERFFHLAGIVKGIASTRNIPIRWGGDWDGDGDFKDQTFDDLVHFEIVR